MPSDRHGQESLNRRLKADLTTFKGLVESGVLGGRAMPTGAATKLFPGPSHTLFSPEFASPASVATRVHRHPPATQPAPHPGAGWDNGAADLGNADPTGTGLTENPLHHAAGASSKPDGGWVSGGSAGSARMGGRTPASDIWGSGMINEEDRGIG